MERGGGYRGRGTGGRGGYRGRGRRGGSGDHHPPPQQPWFQPSHLTVIGQGQGDADWNRMGPQQGAGQGGGTRGGYTGGGRGRGRHEGRGGRVPRPQQERPSYSYMTESTGRGGHVGGPVSGPSSGPWRPAAAATPPSPARLQVHEPALPPSPTQLVPGFAGMNVSEHLASTSSPQRSNRHDPIMRPDKGGVAFVTTVRLQVNHFPVKFNPNSVIWHYDVDVRRVESPRHGHPVKLSKILLSTIRRKLFTDESAILPLLMTAYDGEKNIFSAVELPETEFEVELPEGEDMRSRFKFSIKRVNELKLCKLKEYLTRNVYPIPRDILQGMDVVMKENPSMHMIPVGRSFHPAESYSEDDLGYGLTASRGIQYSLKPTFQGLALCLDYSVLAFRKKMPVLEFLKEHIPGFNVDNFGRFWRTVEEVLRNLKVTVTHRRTNQKYAIVGLTPKTTRDTTFPDANAPQEHINIVDYFLEKYNKNITYLDIPCLDLSKNNKKNYVPMEYCVLVEGQVYPKENVDKIDRDAAIFLKEISLPKPWVRQRKICGMVQAEDGPCGGDIIQNFGIEIDTRMTSVIGRVIQPPVLKLAAPNTGKLMTVTVERDNCQWNLVRKAVVEGRPIERWAVIEFNHDRSSLDSTFISKLIQRCMSLGMKMEQPLGYVKSGMRRDPDTNSLRQLLRDVYTQASGNLQFILCVMSKKDDSYYFLKWISETKIGVVTQCCLRNHANKGQDQYLANLALKINAKLGGSNVVLNDRLPRLQGEDHVMFVGADVNHPGRIKTSPSIAAVVATVNWPEANRYAARVRPQPPGKEQIVQFGEMCLELVEYYSRLNNTKPEKIVLFRDGVSEGQFDMVLNEELMDLKITFEKINYFPTITLIVAQKRHQTRLFPESQKDGSRSGNIPPGTVVDTKIVHPFEFDFYLCSHYGSLGTSKPTHYHVLWDEHGFSSDELQKLIYDMCFTFARCTKPVSLVPPVYYADLVAYRGRLYYQAMERESPISTSASSSSLASSSSSSSQSSASFRDWFKLHANLENMMFFV